MQLHFFTIRKLVPIVVGLLYMITLKIAVANQDQIVPMSPVKLQEQSRDFSTIYYFHGNVRCTTCLNIEKYTKDVFEQKFKDKLNFVSINIDLPQNIHFIDDYQIVSKALILVKKKDGKYIKYKNLQEMWKNVRNEECFKVWLENNVNEFLLSN